MGLRKKAYREITGDKEKDRDVKSSSGDTWYMQVVCSLTNEGKVSVEEFANFFEDSLKNISD